MTKVVTPDDTGRGFFVAVPHAVVRDPRLSSSDKVVFLALCARADNSTGRCWAGHKRLAADVGVSVGTVKSALDRLRELGYVDWISRRRADGGKSSNLYTINYTAGATPVPESADDPEEVEETPPHQEEPTDPHSQNLAIPPHSQNLTMGIVNSCLSHSQESTYERTRTSELAAAAPRAREASTLPLATRLAIVANQATTTRHGESLRPFMPGQAAPLVEAITAQGIDEPFALEYVAGQIAAMPQPPRHLAYFAPGLTEAWEREQARRIAAASPPLVSRETSSHAAAGRVSRETSALRAAAAELLALVQPLGLTRVRHAGEWRTDAERLFGDDRCAAYRRRHAPDIADAAAWCVYLDHLRIHQLGGVPTGLAVVRIAERMAGVTPECFTGHTNTEHATTDEEPA